MNIGPSKLRKECESMKFLLSADIQVIKEKGRTQPIESKCQNYHEVKRLREPLAIFYTRHGERMRVANLIVYLNYLKFRSNSERKS